MTAVQMNAEILRNMSIIAEDEHLMRRAAKYLRKLAAEKEDSTLLTKDEFFARVDKASEETSTEFASAANSIVGLINSDDSIASASLTTFTGYDVTYWLPSLS